MSTALTLRMLVGMEPVLCLAINDARSCAQFLQINRLAGDGIRAARALVEDESLATGIRREASALLPGLRLILEHTCRMAEADPSKLQEELCKH